MRIFLDWLSKMALTKGSAHPRMDLCLGVHPFDSFAVVHPFQWYNMDRWHASVLHPWPLSPTSDGPTIHLAAMILYCSSGLNRTGFCCFWLELNDDYYQINGAWMVDTNNFHLHWALDYHRVLVGRPHKWRNRLGRHIDGLQMPRYH